ncbi:hypothetical protein A3A79_03035 [Candidatus Gottesmanbacteria bacterium RIFCSPLOWO2_01_FULL_43_11b]|uniref:Fibronectin type-III domain-containing protein n=1 Tax=Candidatus Gottesmanbacteria bacterium RIFCSPLOWO2_01_FULL_43_11b TaxID=1798392 RepID=A0A1F6AHA7_9BACT|nr:MAG: hypothetical protein A3A79_03035 [Candidatus Gottesmanbacteria bacterium RIFCSPLOWO2_01_FULL_43_11b]
MRVIAVVFFFVIFIFSLHPTFANNNADPVNSSISTSTTSLPADGATTATISVTVKDSFKNSLSGDHIKLTSSADSGLVINGGPVGVNHHTAATDSNGKVNFTVSSRNASPGTVTFTLTDTSDLPPVTLGSVWVTFTPASLAPDPSCKDSAPTSVPMLQSAEVTGANQITLTWSEAADPVSYYLVAYGTSSKQYTYGNPSVGGKGTISYTVGSLAYGTTYYFVVKAGNGCAPGSYSNELSAVVGGVRITSTPTPTPTLTPTLTQTPTPTETPIPKIPTLVSDSSNTKMLPSIVMILFGLGGMSIGAIIYWKNKKTGEESIEEKQLEED